MAYSELLCTSQVKVPTYLWKNQEVRKKKYNGHPRGKVLYPRNEKKNKTKQNKTNKKQTNKQTKRSLVPFHTSIQSSIDLHIS